MSCASFYCMAAKWGGGGVGGKGRGMTSVCLACDGDICLKLRIKPLKIYSGVELNKQPHKSYRRVLMGVPNSLLTTSFG